jgi:hypothetical protein
LALFFIILSSLGGIFDFGYSKKYILDAGGWLQQNVPAQARLYSNDYQLMYYSQHFGNEIFSVGRLYSQDDQLAKGKWKQFNYIALRTTKHDKKEKIVSAKKFGEPIQVFKNKRGDAISIYEIRGSRP